MARVDQVADGIYRISTFPGRTLSFNQFLIHDDRPTLVHTGFIRCTRMSAEPSQKSSILPA